MTQYHRMDIVRTNVESGVCEFMSYRDTFTLANWGVGSTSNILHSFFKTCTLIRDDLLTESPNGRAVVDEINTKSDVCEKNGTIWYYKKENT